MASFWDCYFLCLATQQSFVIETYFWKTFFPESGLQFLNIDFFNEISIDFCEFQPVAKNKNGDL